MATVTSVCAAVENEVHVLFHCRDSFVCSLSCQIHAIPDLCCIVSWRSVESVGGVFDPVVSSTIAVFEHVKDKLAVIPCLLLATM